MWYNFGVTPLEVQQMKQHPPRNTMITNETARKAAYEAYAARKVTYEAAKKAYEAAREAWLKMCVLIDK